MHGDAVCGVTEMTCDIVLQCPLYEVDGHGTRYYSLLFSGITKYYIYILKLLF